MAREYYILRDGQRLYRETLASISSLAKKEANRLGETVQVFYEDIYSKHGATGQKAVRQPPGAKFHMSRNPKKSGKRSAPPGLMGYTAGKRGDPKSSCPFSSPLDRKSWNASWTKGRAAR